MNLRSIFNAAHILRHTYITRLFEAGRAVKEIQYLTGHSTMDMTLKVYTHYDRRSREAKTAEKVRNAFRPAYKNKPEIQGTASIKNFPAKHIRGGKNGA